ncbi:MAG: winged helix-turn-helix domain-containing protein [Bdellovibrionota bacterium]
MSDVKKIILVGNLSICNNSRNVVVRDEQNYEHTLKFTQTEFRLLTCLASQPEKVFSREELFGRAWGQDPSDMGRNVDVHICQVRKKLTDKSTHTIQALSGVGYKLTQKRKPKNKP